MLVKEYLRQAYFLDQRIKADMMECEELRKMAESISSPGFEEHYNASRNTDAPYNHTLEKLWKMEERVMVELAQMVNLKNQIQELVRQVDKPEEQTVLRYIYIHNYTWPRIGELLNADPVTVQRWHNKAISKIKLPENAINLKVAMVCNGLQWS